MLSTPTLRPLMNTWVISVRASSGSPFEMNRSARLPGSRLPTSAATPRILAASIVMADSARSRGRPQATDCAAWYGNSRTLVASLPPLSAKVTPASASGGGRLVGRRVVVVVTHRQLQHGPEDDGHLLLLQAARRRVAPRRRPR